MSKYIGISEDRLHHILGFARKCYQIAKSKGLNEYFCRRMFMIGWLHDIGYEFSEKQEEHPQISANMLYNLGDCFGVVTGFSIDEQNYINSEDCFNKEFLNAVSAIKEHGKHINKSSLELDILNIADLTVDSKGNDVDVTQRLDDIKARYGEHSNQYITACDIAVQVGLIENSL